MSKYSEYEHYEHSARIRPNPPTNMMQVYIRAQGIDKTYGVNLDSRWDAKDWERKYLQEGFREPNTGYTILPQDVETVHVTPMLNGPGGPPTQAAIDWLRESVEKTCAAGY